MKARGPLFPVAVVPADGASSVVTGTPPRSCLQVLKARKPAGSACSTTAAGKEPA